MILKFGKFKGQELSSTPEWYQKWLKMQDWFIMPTIQTQQDNKLYALIENGVIHTGGISLEDAIEMKERHSRCFPECNWEVLPMNAVIGMDKAEGILERHMRISAKYA